MIRGLTSPDGSPYRLSCAAFVLGAVLAVVAAAAPAAGQGHHHATRLPAETLPAPPLMDGIGTSSMPITTDSEVAQKYFDQGVNLLHGYWDFEALRAFREAIRLDGQAAMAHWGLYMSLSYNQVEHRALREQALEAAERLAPRVSDREQRYIRAITRLNEIGGLDGQRAFVAEMESLIAAHPQDLEAELFLIKFLVNDAAGAFLDPDRGVGNGFDRARERLRPLLVSHPDSSAVHHYWIHVHEYGPEPEAARISAEKLPRLAPKAGHLLHMPGHIYFKTGEYEKAYDAFHASLRFDRAYMEEQGVAPVDNWNYVHNLDYLVANCAEDGRYAEGLRWAGALQTLPSAPSRPDAVGLGYIIYGGRTAPARFHLRYGQWQAAAASLEETLATWDVPGSLGVDYLRGLLTYARGMAFAEAGDPTSAEKQLRELASLSLRLTQAEAQWGSDWYFDIARRILAISSLELGAMVASGAGQVEQALQGLVRAVKMEEGLGYGEPPHYMRPVRESFAQVLLSARAWGDAEQVYRQVLNERPDSGHAWVGIARSYAGAGNVAEARRAYRRFLEVWRHADSDLPAVVEARAWLEANP